MVPQASPSRIRSVFISADEPRLRTGWRLLLHVLLTALFSIFLYFFAAQSFPQSLVTDLFLQALAILGATWLARRWIDKRSFVSLGFATTPWTWADLVVGFFLPGAVMGVLFLIEGGLGWISIEGFLWEPASQDNFTSILVYLLAFIAAGFYEELLYRGYQLQNLIEGTSLFWGFCLSALLFGLSHLISPHANWISVLVIALVGWLLAYGWYRTRALWLPIAFHIGWNFFEGPIFGFPVSGIITPALVQQQSVGPAPLTGGDFGPEGGLLILPLIGLAALLLRAYTRRREPHPAV